MKCLFLYNPNGRKKILRKLGYIERRLGSVYGQVDVVPTASGEDMTRLAREGAEQYDLILFSGGDGTFNNVLQGIGDADVRLGYLPAGTVNDVARSLGIPRSVKGALKVVLGGRCEALDCMRVNGAHYAMYVAAAGAFTSATYRTPQRKKHRFGRAAYAAYGLRHNLPFRIFPVEVTCGEEHVSLHSVFIFVLNGRSVAGMPVNRPSSMQDGMLEVALIRQKERPGFFRKLGGYFALAAVFLFGIRVRRKDVLFLRGNAVTIRTEPDTVWDFDGEEGVKGDVEIEVLPRRVKLFVPKNKKV